ncbi:MAG: hypothetical protein HYV04_09205 [Deltaproteobacteria bacterium]|nr:hypothetical protein [Deltaproteobacteria bacterium]
MIRIFPAALALASMLASPGAFVAAVGAQEDGGVVDKILNPMPVYDPFDKPASAPQFFPDAVDKQTRATLIDSLTSTGHPLEDPIRFFEHKDRDLSKERGAVTGLTDKVRDLYRGRSAERYEELTAAEGLLRKSSANRFGAMFNRLLSSVDLVSIVSGSYVGAAVDSAMSQLFTLGQPEMSIEERKALVHLQNHLKLYPDHPQAEATRKQVEVLEKKKQRALAQKRLDKAEAALKEGDLSRAEFHNELAVVIDPEFPKAKKVLETVRESLRQQAQARDQALSVADQESAKAKQTQDVTELLYALALREPGRIEAQAKLLGEEKRGDPLGESAKDALAVAAEIRGRHEQAKQILEHIARSAGDPRERRRAEILLGSPEYNRLASLEKARSQHRLQTVKYVLLGEDFLKKNLIYGTAPLVVAGPAGATSLAAANMLIIGTNLFEVLTANPISPQPIIDNAVAYVRDHPDSESATEVYRILAQTYEDAGRYDRALFYYELSGRAGAKKLADLKEKAARGFLQAAEKSEDRDSRAFYLKTVMDRYPDTEAAKTATQRLAQLAKMENQGLRLSKQFLREHPELYGPQGLGLKAALFDGNLSNMEIADRGLNFLSEREIFIHFQTPWGIRSQTYTLTQEDSDRFLMTLRQKRYENPEKLKDLPLAPFGGELGKKKTAPEREDTTLTLVREVPGVPTRFPKVLDYELLSENEKRPGGAFQLPQIQGSIGAHRFDLSGSLPAGLWADRLALGTDARSPFAGVQLPIPMLPGFIPIDFLLQARPGGFSVFPKIHQSKDKGEDQELYR